MISIIVLWISNFPLWEPLYFEISGSPIHALGFISESEEQEEKKQRQSNYKKNLQTL